MNRLAIYQTDTEVEHACMLTPTSEFCFRKPMQGWFQGLDKGENSSSPTTKLRVAAAVSYHRLDLAHCS